MNIETTSQTNRKKIITFALLFASLPGTIYANNAMAQSVTGSGDVLVSPNAASDAPTEPAPITSPNWVTGKELIVGQSGVGNIDIKDGGSISATALNTGFKNSSTGRVNVDGYDVSTGKHSSLEIFRLDVGNQGNGELNISNGGQVTTKNGATTIAIAGGPGIINIDGVAPDGVSSTLRTGGLVIGNGSHGTVNVTNGGELYSDYANLSQSDVGSGTATIRGVHPSGTASAWKAVSVELGTLGDGTLNVFDGGSVLVKEYITAGALGGTGTLNVSGVKMGHPSTIKTGEEVLMGTSGIFVIPGSHSTGTLNLSDGGIFEAPLIQLGVDNDTTGTINIGTGSMAGILKTPIVTTGTGNATVNFNHTDNIEFSPKLTGLMTVTKSAAGITTLMTTSDYTGTTTVSGGTLKAGAANVFSQRSDFTLYAPGVLSVNDHDQIIKNLNNAGTVDLGQVAGTTLTVRNNYAGNNGTLLLRTKLGDDTSVTDRLVVNGNTTGTTNVRVKNDGGVGDLTNKGIEIIHVNGKSDGNFLLQGRVVAGAYDYFLHKGTPESGNGNWYLRSELPTQKPETPVKPEAPESPVIPPESPVETPEVPTTKPSFDVLRPEAGVYTANIAAANTLFTTTMHERLGETYYTDVLTGEKKATSMWLRNTGGHNNWRDSSGELKTQSNRYLLQMGGDIAQWVSPDNSRIHLGVMAGYASQQTKTRSSLTNYQAKGSLSGYTAGIYGIWQENDGIDNGAYVDTWAQYNWFSNQINGEQIDDESYKSLGIVASLETGYTIKVGEVVERQGRINAWYIQPQAQLTWMGVKAPSHTEANGTDIKSMGDGNIQTRLGLRTYIKGHSSMDEGNERNFEPFIEMNWLHNTKNFGVRMNGAEIYQNGASDLGEIKLGTDGQINSSLNLWGQIITQIGGKGYNDTQATLGIKYIF
ncbi:autotransporter outer membrane beta-barrel domain-containing protein [Salmonella enterica]|nr:autotransporter outer membrane beta-barrel domain-containing protein [Salmonella enterica]ECL0814768.1 autotransporter outer membrane beta-barrel domain-containing protein [Salmonella enterica]ECW3560805.1 autotransporter outer membrane beta-barrel domain-containing protein [Salmonella enterica]